MTIAEQMGSAWFTAAVAAGAVSAAAEPVLTVDEFTVCSATGLYDYVCPGCETEREMTRARWEQGPTLRCKVCNTLYRITPATAENGR